MTDQQWLAVQFEQQRPRLTAVAYRMLGSTAEADDAVQDTWLRASAAFTADIENVGAWLTTIVSRIALNVLRSRVARRENPLEFVMPELVVSSDPRGDAEHQAILADSVGIALLVVLESLTPAERLAFVLHDLFAVPFEEIAAMLDRTPESTRQLASRARRRVQGRAPAPDSDLSQQRRVVDAFFAAARDGDFDALVAVLHPDAVFRASGLGPVAFVLTGAETVAGNARLFGPQSPAYRHIVVNGHAGVAVHNHGVLASITGFTIANGLIVAIDVLADAERLKAYRVD